MDMYIYIYIHVYVCVHACMYVYLHVYRYARKCTYIQTHVSNESKFGPTALADLRWHVIYAYATAHKTLFVYMPPLTQRC